MVDFVRECIILGFKVPLGWLFFWLIFCGISLVISAFGWGIGRGIGHAKKYIRN